MWGPCFPQEPLGNQVPRISWSSTRVKKAKGWLRDPQGEQTLLKGLALQDPWDGPAWLRQESCLQSLGKSAFAQDSLLPGRNLLCKSPTRDGRNVPLCSHTCMPWTKSNWACSPKLSLLSKYDQVYSLVWDWGQFDREKWSERETASEFLPLPLINSKTINSKDKELMAYAKPAGSPEPRMSGSGGITDGCTIQCCYAAHEGIPIRTNLLLWTDVGAKE